MGMPHLSYKAASQIFEGHDLGFTSEEIKELISPNRRRRNHFSQKTVDYALSHHAELESRIIGALRRIFPDREINKPYLGQ